MKKRERKDKENITHRGNSRNLMRKYKMQMDAVHKVPTSYYSQDGELKRISSAGEKIG